MFLGSFSKNFYSGSYTFLEGIPTRVVFVKELNFNLPYC